MGSEVKDVDNTLSPEYRLLLTCLRRNITEKEQEAIDTLAAVHINWDVFVHLAINHGVYPLVYQFLSTLKYPAVPPSALSLLRQKSRDNMPKTLQMSGELVKVLRAMEEKGIRVVVLKGFPLGYKLYGNVAIRPAHDLDILVWPEAVDRAREVIEALGYNRTYPDFATTSRQLRDWMRLQHHFIFWHKDKEVMLELHWKLGHPGIDIPLTYVENTLMQVEMAGQLVHILGNEELLLSLVLHGASHRWFRLKWLCDIGILLERGDFSWERLSGLTEKLGVRTLLNQAIILTKQLLVAPVPPNIAEAAIKDQKAQKLAAMALPVITRGPSEITDQKMTGPSYFERKKYEFYLQCGWRRKFTYVHNHIMPTETDIESISLPGYLYFIYYLIRPFTWFGGRIAKLAEK